MRYEQVVTARFLTRPNRFIAHCELAGRVVTAHVKNTGRCRELLVPGATVYLQDHRDAPRKTRYSLIAVDKGGLLINMDSQAPNHVVREALAAGCLSPVAFPPTLIRPETTWGDSRLDFYLAGEEPGQQGFVEVKGVTLEEEGVVLFPDAPTQRGAKHLATLAQAVAAGYEAMALFLVQMSGVSYFTPNWRTDPDFAAALQLAAAAGVRVTAYTCQVTPDSLLLDAPLPVRLE